MAMNKGMYGEYMKQLKKRGMGEREATLEAYPEAQGLMAVVERQKKQKEAQDAASGKVETGKPVEKVEPVVVAPPSEKKPASKPDPKMPKDEVDALRIAEQLKWEEKQRKKAQVK